MFLCCEIAVIALTDNSYLKNSLTTKRASDYHSCDSTMKPGRQARDWIKEWVANVTGAWR
jgi:hypothetical protein